MKKNLRWRIGKTCNAGDGEEGSEGSTDSYLKCGRQRQKSKWQAGASGVKAGDLEISLF
jgi:hypothetical protein